MKQKLSFDLFEYNKVIHICIKEDFDSFCNGELLWCITSNELFTPDCVEKFSKSDREMCFSYDEYKQFADENNPYFFSEVINTFDEELVVFGFFKAAKYKR